jgi:hypothetical protein
MVYWKFSDHKRNLRSLQDLNAAHSGESRGLGGAGCYPGDPHKSQILPLPLFALRIFPPPLLECDRLRPPGVFHDLTGNTGAVDNRAAKQRFITISDHQHAIECHAVASLASKRHEANRIAGGDLVLLATSCDDCVQFSALVSQRYQRREPNRLHGQNRTPQRPWPVRCGALASGKSNLGVNY